MPQFKKQGVEDCVFIKLNRAVDISWFSLKACNQIVFDLKEAFFPEELVTSQINSDIIRTIRTSRHNEDVVRVTLGLKPGARYNFSTSQQQVKGHSLLTLCIYPMTAGGLPGEVSDTFPGADNNRTGLHRTEPGGPFLDTGSARVQLLPAQLSGLRLETKAGCDQVIINLNRQVDTSWFFLKSPDRIVVDIKHAFIPQVHLSKEVDGLNIKTIRAAQNQKDVVRPGGFLCGTACPG